MGGTAIREMMSSEYPLLRRFTYEAIFQRYGEKPLPISVVDGAEMTAYYADFGRKGDHCLAAEAGGRVIGAVWARIGAGGYGSVDGETPELSIAVLKDFRGRGIGAALMEGMLALLKEHGYQRASLSVQKANRAARLYDRLGFRVLRETDEEQVMVRPL